MLFEAVEQAQKWSLNARGLRSREVSIPGGTAHVYDGVGQGNAPTILVLHGINSTAAQYSRVLPGLLKVARRVIAPDLPGHGRTGVPADGLAPHTMEAGLLAVVDAVLEEPAVVFGNSMGGLAAVKLALSRPDRVRGLMLSSPGGAAVTSDELQAFLANFRLESRRDALAFVDKVHASPPWYRWLIANGTRRGFRRPEMQGFIGQVGLEHLVTREELQQLKMPVQLWWGKADSLMPEQHRQFYKDNLPSHAEVFEPEDFGHCPYLDRPEKLTKVIADFALKFA